MISLAPTNDGWETVRVVNPDLTVLPVRGSIREDFTVLSSVRYQGSLSDGDPVTESSFFGLGDLDNSDGWPGISCSLNFQPAEEDWLFSYSFRFAGSVSYS